MKAAPHFYASPQLRWFKIDAADGVLRYYKDEKAAKGGDKPLGEIVLKTAEIADHVTGHKDGKARHPKLDITTPKKTYQLVYADTPAGKNERYSWRTALEAVKEAHK